MAGRREIMQLLDQTLEWAVALHAKAAATLFARDREQPPEEQEKTAQLIARTGKMLTVFAAASFKTADALADITRAAGDAPEEIDMDDDDGDWTPERLERFSAQLQRRLDALARSLDRKGLDPEQSGRGLGGVPGLEDAGAASGAAA